MGLDLCVEGRPKPGHEAEWRAIVARSFADKPRKGDEERFEEISIPPFADLDAPRVGRDPAADEWIIKVRKAATAEEVAEVLREFDGHYALPLVENCDGLPKWSHANLYAGVDETSLRGKVLEFCDDVITEEQIHAAWEHKLPEQATDYGRALLAAADTAERDGPLPIPPPPPPKRIFFFFRSRPREMKRSCEFPLEEQIEIIRMAGKWFIFWGERGNAIRAWF